MVDEITDGSETALFLSGRDVPAISEELCVWLEGLYPARCKTPLEPLEAHMEYAGMVKLVAKLRDARKAQLDEAIQVRLRQNGEIELRPVSSRTPSGRRPSVPRIMKRT